MAEISCVTPCAFKKWWIYVMPREILVVLCLVDARLVREKKKEMKSRMVDGRRKHERPRKKTLSARGLGYLSLLLQGKTYCYVPALHTCTHCFSVSFSLFGLDAEPFRTTDNISAVYISNNRAFSMRVYNILTLRREHKVEVVSDLRLFVGGTWIRD